MALLLGTVVVLVPTVVITLKIVKSNRDQATPSTSTRDSNDYQPNSDYYRSLSSAKNFEQSDNLRLDRVSSPTFHPIHGENVIYLRRQTQMSDLRVSTTTLHWLDLETNKTVQLTRPIWGVHDGQVRL